MRGESVEATLIVSSGVVKELACVRPWIPGGATSPMVKLRTGTDGDIRSRDGVQ